MRWSASANNQPLPNQGRACLAVLLVMAPKAGRQEKGGKRQDIDGLSGLTSTMFRVEGNIDIGESKIRRRIDEEFQSFLDGLVAQPLRPSATRGADEHR